MDNAKDMYKPDEIECDTNPSNLSTTTSNESNAMRYGQVHEDKENIRKKPSGQIDLLEPIKDNPPLIDPRELLEDALSIIKELPKGKENHGGFFQNSLFSKNARYKNEFKDLKTLPEFFEAFAKMVGNDMKIHKSFGAFKKELLSNSNLPNK